MNIPEGKVLGKLCKGGHDWNETGKSLRYAFDGRCCECDKQHRDKYYKKHKEYMREKSQKHNMEYSKTEAGKSAHNRAIRKYYKKYPNRKKTHKKLEGAIASGKITKHPCAICGSNNVHAHHQDYTKPFEVIWLCPKHHKMVHSGELEIVKL